MLLGFEGREVNVECVLLSLRWGGEYTVEAEWIVNSIGEGVMPVALSFGAGLVAMIFVSIVTPKPTKETIDKFFPNFG